MKVAIIGSRDFTDYKLLEDTLDMMNLNPTFIISGGARGADTLAMEYANKRGIPTKVYEAHWNDLNARPLKIKTNSVGVKYNALAGFNRNKLIVNDADVIIAFWDGQSPGTKNSVEYADKKGKRVHIIQI